MNYSFDIKEAKKYGVNEAIMINNFKFWIIKNYANNKHRYEGRTWTYNSLNALGEIFPFWSIRQIRYTLESLIKQDVLITSNFNEDKRDRTLWYAFRDEEFLGEKSASAFDEKSKTDLTKSETSFDEKGKCIIGTDIKQADINKTDIKTPELTHSEAKASSFVNSTPLEQTNSLPLQAKKETLKAKESSNSNLNSTCNSNMHKAVVAKNTTTQLPSFIKQEIWDEWVKHRKEIGHALKPTTIQKQLKQLAKWHEAGYDANDIIEQSVYNGYQGLFIPKSPPAKKDNDGGEWSFEPFKEGWSW